MITQGTEEWLAIRRNKVGASDAPAIMGVSPYKTIKQLWQEKLGLSVQPDNWAMQRGREQEPVARAAFEQYMGQKFAPDFVLHPEHEWMCASLDGISVDRNAIVEIKLAKKQDHDVALAGGVPQKYYPQLQHQMAVTGLNTCYYFSWSGSDGCVVEVPQSLEYTKQMIEEEKKFITCVWNITEPQSPDISDEECETIEDEQRLRLAKELVTLAPSVARYAELKKQLIQLTSAPARGGGIAVTRKLGQGRVNYSKVPQLLGVDLEPYRGKPVESWQVDIL